MPLPKFKRERVKPGPSREVSEREFERIVVSIVRLRPVATTTEDVMSYFGWSKPRVVSGLGGLRDCGVVTNTPTGKPLPDPLPDYPKNMKRKDFLGSFWYLPSD